MLKKLQKLAMWNPSSLIPSVILFAISYGHEMMVEYLLCYFYQFFVAQKTVIFFCGKSAERNSYKSRNKSLPVAEPLSDRQALAKLIFCSSGR